MAQRNSGYERKANDLYETPEWVTDALVPFIPEDITKVWEPACGNGKILDRLGTKYVFDVVGTDLSGGRNFLEFNDLIDPQVQAIITNPPFNLATEFIEHALKLTEKSDGFVAMLLGSKFDHAKSRQHLFRYHDAFKHKVHLLKRIVWFEPPPGSKGKGPSENHCWFIWDWKHVGDATVEYAP